jgi:hypothetical protein
MSECVTFLHFETNHHVLRTVMGGLKIKIGDKVEILADGKVHLEHGHFGKVVWMSEDEKGVAIQCERKHDGKVSVFLVKNNYKK